MASPWVEVIDPSTGRKFYANTETGQAVWELPQTQQKQQKEQTPAQSNVEWWELFDENTKRPYYYNTVTKETSWHKPPGVNPIPLSELYSAFEADDDTNSANTNTPTNSNNASTSTSAQSQSSIRNPRRENRVSSVNIDVTEGFNALDTIFNKLDVLDKSEGGSSDTPIARADESTAANEPQLLPGWTRVLDKKTGHYYYVNTLTSETTWSISVATGKAAGSMPASATASAGSRQSCTQKSLSQSSLLRQHMVNTSPATTRANRMSGSATSLMTINTANSATTTATAAASTATTQHTHEAGNVRRHLSFAEIAPDPQFQSPTHRKSMRIEASASADRLRASGSFTPLVEGEQPKDLLKEINKFKLEGYAKKHFETHKKGLFRRQVPVKEMLMWQKDPIPTSLLRLFKSSSSKEAVVVFKMIMTYMGDRPGKGDLVLGQQVISKGINVPELRDEIYCQLCKQTCYNPNNENNLKGWELLALCTCSFPPTKDFEEYLRQYISEHLKLKTKEAAYASYCLRKLDRICKVGPSGRVPTLRELSLAKDAPFMFSPFGATIDEIMEHQRTTHPHLQVPHILVVLTDAVIRLNGCVTEGIFRVPGDTEAVYDLKLQIEQGNYEIGQVHPNVPASLLKLWLRELHEPLIPSNLYELCTKGAEVPGKCVNVVKKLPLHHQRTLVYLVRFLQIIADPANQAVTKMTVNNIAMVFAPNFLRCPSDNPQVILDNTKYEQAFVRNLITELNTDSKEFK